MSQRRRRGRADRLGLGQLGSVQPWGRGRLLAALIGLVTMVMLLVAGLGYGMLHVMTSHHGGGKVSSAASSVMSAGGSSGSTGDAVQGRRDALAAAPMLRVSEADSESGTPASTPAPVMVVPDSTRMGPVRVPSGFPHTPSGAVAQLAVLEQSVLMPMDMAVARQVYGSWSAPGARDITQWGLLDDIRGFLSHSGAGTAKDPTTQVQLTPVAGQVKATDGPDWTVACVLMDVQVTISDTARAAYGYCEAMTWRQGRWEIAPGVAAAEAPSTWPGTELALRAGWRSWTPGH